MNEGTLAIVETVAVSIAEVVSAVLTCSHTAFESDILHNPESIEALKVSKLKLTFKAIATKIGDL
jgi:hypothetical protein